MPGRGVSGCPTGAALTAGQWSGCEWESHRGGARSGCECLDVRRGSTGLFGSSEDMSRCCA